MSKYKIVTTLYYIVHMVKNREFMFVRFYDEDYEKGQCGARLIENKFCKPFKDDGWEILPVERQFTTKTVYD